MSTWVLYTYLLLHLAWSNEKNAAFAEKIFAHTNTRKKKLQLFQQSCLKAIAWRLTFNEERILVFRSIFFVLELIAFNPAQSSLEACEKRARTLRVM